MSVIGGFLGAGKTTLLNRVLAGRHGVRYAVLVNDFGELNVDGDLVAAHGGDTITFANGCVCCTMGGDLVGALDRLLDGDRPPDQILVEASGVADPSAIADVATLHPGLARDLVVVLADAETVRARHADERLRDTVDRQLAAADLIVLNKCDRVTDEGVRGGRSRGSATGAAPRSSAPSPPTSRWSCWPWVARTARLRQGPAALPTTTTSSGRSSCRARIRSTPAAFAPPSRSCRRGCSAPRASSARPPARRNGSRTPMSGRGVWSSRRAGGRSRSMPGHRRRISPLRPPGIVFIGLDDLPPRGRAPRRHGARLRPVTAIEAVGTDCATPIRTCRRRFPGSGGARGQGCPSPGEAAPPAPCSRETVPRRAPPATGSGQAADSRRRGGRSPGQARSSGRSRG